MKFCLKSLPFVDTNDISMFTILAIDTADAILSEPLRTLLESMRVSINSLRGISFNCIGEEYSPTDFGLTSSVNEHIEYFDAFLA